MDIEYESIYCSHPSHTYTHRRTTARANMGAYTSKETVLLSACGTTTPPACRAALRVQVTARCELNRFPRVQPDHCCHHRAACNYVRIRRPHCGHLIGQILHGSVAANGSDVFISIHQP